MMVYSCGRPTDQVPFDPLLCVFERETKLVFASDGGGNKGQLPTS